jgi:hypothetical protein
MDDEVVRYYSVSTTAVTNTGMVRGGEGLSPFGMDPSVHNNLICVGSYELAAGQDLNGDADQADIVVRYYDAGSSSIENTGAVGLAPCGHGDIIAFDTYESHVGMDLNGDSDQNDYVLRYYRISNGQLVNTAELAYWYDGSSEIASPSVKNNIMTYAFYESYYGSDVSGDGDQNDNIVRYIEVIDYRPIITRIEDVGNDQGRQVRIRWLASGLDKAGSTKPITEYSIFRRDDPLPVLGYPAGDWDWVATVPAYAESIYSTVVPTLADSTASGGIHWSAFFVRAATDTSWIYYDSPVDSGYSVDNLAPAPPGSLTMPTSTDLAWDEAPEEDFDYFTVYGSPSPVLDGSATLIGYTTGTEYDITGSVYDYYHVTATDFAGNEGDEASLANEFAGILPEEIWPTRLTVGDARPNPFTGSAEVMLGLPAGAHVSVRVYDVEGRLVRTLADAAMPGGWHSLTWDGTEASGRKAGPGIYFCRIDAGTEGATRKMVRIK